MMLRDLHDRAYVYVDGELKKTFDVMKPDGLIKRIMKKDGLLLNLKNEETELGILVDAMGRVNYGEHLMDRKGISAVNLNLQTVMDYEVTTLPLDNIEKLDLARFTSTASIWDGTGKKGRRRRSICRACS